MKRYPRVAGAVSITAVLVAGFAATAADAQARTRHPAGRLITSVSIALEGATQDQVSVCGTQRTATVVPASAGGITARMRFGSRRVRGRKLNDRATYVLDRCVDTHWVRVTRTRVLAAKRSFSAPIPVAASGDLRVRGRARGGRLVSKAYLHVAQAELPDGVVSRDVRFKVHNTNTTPVPCQSDGKDYEIRGQLVGKSSTLAAQPKAVTLYLHGLDVGEFFWNFRAVAGYDYASQMADDGHVSVVIDRLGYDSSPHPPGNDVCTGSQADMAHQIVQQLRAGSYSSDGGTPPKFAKVVLAGHSLAGSIVSIEAYSYKDVDGLMVLSWSDQGSTQDAKSAFTQAGAKCVTGGENAENGGPSGYEAFGPTEDDFKSEFFVNADKNVMDAAAALRNLNPCGDMTSVPQTIATDSMHDGEITVPVLVLSGRDDPVFDANSMEGQAAMYGSQDKSVVLIDKTSHGLTLERTAPQFRAEVGKWLTARGLTP